jgi:hypothetical protein
MAGRQLRPDDGDIVNVTPEMIEAGVKVLYDSCAIENPIRGTDRLLVGEIYKAMRAVLSRASRPMSSIAI